MSAVRLYGFPLSTYVNVARLVLTHKGVPYDFHDLEPDMGGQRHLALHPFNRVPILEHATSEFTKRRRSSVTSMMSLRDTSSHRPILVSERE